MVAHLVGIACEGIISPAISLAIEKATTAKLQEAAKTLEEIDAESLPLEQILAIDDYCVWRLSDWKMRLFYRKLQPRSGSLQSDLFAIRARRDAVRAQLRTAIALELDRRDQE